MNLEQLRELSRAWLDDRSSPPLWSDVLVDQYLNEAVREAAIRARLLLDSSSPAVCQIALVAGQCEYRLHPSVIVIKRAATALDPDQPLTRARFSTLDDACPRWRTESGRPVYLVQDLNRGKITLAPIPDAATTLYLTVMRYPTEGERMEQLDDEPAIAEQHHEALCHWVCFRALITRDVEQYSADSAKDHLALFERVFGEKPSAKVLQLLATDPGGSTTSYFF